MWQLTALGSKSVSKIWQLSSNFPIFFLKKSWILFKKINMRHTITISIFRKAKMRKFARKKKKKKKTLAGTLLKVAENYEPWNWPLFLPIKRYKKYSIHTHGIASQKNPKLFNVWKVCPWLANYVQISCANRSCLRFYSIAMETLNFFGVHLSFCCNISHLSRWWWVIEGFL